jgi:hypothetical protein
MDIQTIGQTLVLILVCYWLYKCTVTVTENRFKVVEGWTGRYIRTISGSKDERVATQKDEDNSPKDAQGNPTILLGDIILGKDNGSIDFILWPLQQISTYQMRKIVRKSSADLTELEKKNLAWGKAEQDTEVSLTETSISNHYRKQFTYEMHFDGLSTGETQGVADSPAQNVKMRVRLNVTTYACNIFQSRYQEDDGGKWLTTLQGVIMSALSEIFGANSFDDISKLRTAKFNDIELADGKKFLERVDTEMLQIKKLGQGVSDINFLADEVMDESKDFVKAKEDAVRATIEKAAAADRGAAIALLLAPKVTAAKTIMNLDTVNRKSLKQTEDATTVKKFASLATSNIRVYVDGAQNESSNSSGKSVDVDKIIQGVVNLDIVKEINDESEDKDPGKKTKGGK